MNLSVCIHLNDKLTESANFRYGDNVLHISNQSIDTMIFGTPEQFLQLADTIYAKHGEYQKELSQREGQEELNHTHKVELEVAV